MKPYACHYYLDKIPIKDARMLPSFVANYMTTNNDAIIYDHDHSKHINGDLRCRKDNDSTCLNCKVDFLLEMLTITLLLSSPPYPPPHLLLKCKQSRSVPQLICPSLTHITCAHRRSFYFTPSFPRSLCVSLSAMIKASFVTLCEASRKHTTSNR